MSGLVRLGKTQGRLRSSFRLCAAIVMISQGLDCSAVPLLDWFRSAKLCDGRGYEQIADPRDREELPSAPRKLRRRCAQCFAVALLPPAVVSAGSAVKEMEAAWKDYALKTRSWVCVYMGSEYNVGRVGDYCAYRWCGVASLWKAFPPDLEHPGQSVLRGAGVQCSHQKGPFTPQGSGRDTVCPFGQCDAIYRRNEAQFQYGRAYYCPALIFKIPPNITVPDYNRRCTGVPGSSAQPFDARWLRGPLQHTEKAVHRAVVAVGLVYAGALVWKLVNINEDGDVEDAGGRQPDDEVGEVGIEIEMSNVGGEDNTGE